MLKNGLYLWTESNKKLTKVNIKKYFKMTEFIILMFNWLKKTFTKRNVLKQ